MWLHRFLPNKFVLWEAEDWAKVLGGQALKETLGYIQTNLDAAEDTEFSIGLQLFTNSREVNFIKNKKKTKTKSISIGTL